MIREKTMFRKFLFYILKWLAVVMLMVLIKCTSAPKADLLIHNGTIYTVDATNPVAGMVAVRDGKIIHVGTAEEAGEWLEKSVKVIDLQGRTMTPGLIDAHAHFLGLGWAKMNLNLATAKSYDDIIAMVAEAARNTPKGEWIQGRGWHQDKWEKLPDKMVRGFQVHDALSAATPDHPVFLRHASGHAAMANAKAMEIAGVTSATTVEGDGEVIKDENGNPTGIFTENAMSLIESHIPESTPEMNRRKLELAMQECVQNGITGFHDAGADSSAIALFKQAAAQKNLTVRLWVMLSGSEGEDFLNDWFSNGPLVGYGDNFLTVRSVKLYADGALGSRGAWLLDEYSDRPGHFGNALMPMENVYELSKKALNSGFQICTHAIGDRANREVLNQYERAFNDLPDKAKNSRFRIEHAQHISGQDIPRFADLGVIASMQPIHMSSDRPWAIDRLGKARIEEGAYVWRKLLDSGAKIAIGTDAPVEPINPIANFYAAVTRRTLDGFPPGGFEPAQKMTREEALRAYTLDAAYAAFEENLKGSIEVGKLADFTVFSQNIMQVPEDDLLKTTVEMTIVDGKVVYQKDAQ